MLEWVSCEVSRLINCILLTSVCIAGIVEACNSGVRALRSFRSAGRGAGCEIRYSGGVILGCLCVCVLAGGRTLAVIDRDCLIPGKGDFEPRVESEVVEEEGWMGARVSDAVDDDGSMM